VYYDRIHWDVLVGYDDNVNDGKLYKYLYFANGKEQLFCLSDDPNEHTNVSKQQGGMLVVVVQQQFDIEEVV